MTKKSTERRLGSEKQELQGHIKRAYQQLNILKVRNDYLEHKLQQYLEEEQSVLGDEDEDEDEIVIVGGKWD